MDGQRVYKKALLSCAISRITYVRETARLLCDVVAVHVQESAKEWAIGCVIPAPWPPLAAATHITQPRACSVADPCTVSIYANTLVCNCDVCGGCFLDLR